MHIETATPLTDHDEHESISFADLYNLYEIIGKYVISRSFVSDLIVASRQRTIQCCSALHEQEKRETICSEDYRRGTVHFNAWIFCRR